MKPLAYILPLGLALGFASCNRNMQQAVKNEQIPVDLSKTTLLVQKFEYEDPMQANPFYVNKSDSLQKLTGITYTGPKTESDDEPRMIENPLIVETNKNLDMYNRKLEEVAADAYKYQYKVVSDSQMKTDASLQDVNQYRYVLMYKPVLHCYEDPNNKTIVKYTYMYYFYDRQTGQRYSDIEVFSNKPWRTTKAILDKASTVVVG